MYYIKVSPSGEVMRFEYKGKLHTRYVVPFQIYYWKGSIVEWLYHQSLEMNNISSINAKEYVLNPTHILEFVPIYISGDMTFCPIAGPAYKKE